MQHFLKTALVMAGLGLLAGGCSGSNTAGVSQQQFPQEFADAYCDTIAPCCTAAAIPYTAATCKGNLSAIGAEFIQQGVSAKLQYEPAGAGQCLDEVRAALQSCGSLDNVKCRSVFNGTTPQGGACEQSVQCANAGFCDNGTCTTQPFRNLPHGKSGEACNGSCSTDGNSSVCDSSSLSGATCFDTDGLYCDFLSSTCLPFAVAGEPCQFGGCVTGTYCAAGQCAPRKPGGAPCLSSEECESDRCSAGTCASSAAATPDSCQGMP